MLRLRIKYEKTGLLRYVSHLEMVRLNERVFRRMKLPLAFTQGFNPHPKMSFASPLSVGVESCGELIDVELDESIDIDQFLSESTQHLPNGLRFTDARYIDEKASLMSLVSAAGYRLSLSGVDPAALDQAVADMMIREDVQIVKKGGKGDGKTVNLRPLIYSLSRVESSDGVALEMIIASGSNGSAKPEWVVAALGLGDDKKVDRTLRTRLYLGADKGLSPIME